MESDKTKLWLIASVFLACFVTAFLSGWPVSTGREFWWDGLVIVEKIAVFLTGVAAVVAMSEYIKKNWNDERLVVTEHISFFREKVLPEFKSAVKTILEKKGKDYRLRPVGFKVPSLLAVRDSSFDDSRHQLEILRDPEIADAQQDALNIMEELSFKILTTKTSDHPALLCIKSAFVKSFEAFSVHALFQKDIVSGSGTYSNVIELYLLWESQVDRTSPNDRIAMMAKGQPKIMS